MKYKNKNTGFIIETPSKLLGAWVPYDPKLAKKSEPVVTPAPEQAPQATETPEENTGNADFDNITRAQIMQELDAFNIKYDKRANKQTLYDLMMNHGK
ncbi:hypothetical protein ACYSNU_18505 [Enterococcus sp. LJL120]